MRRFDFFEFVGVIVPGGLFLFGLILIFPELREFFVVNASLLELGYFIILAYIAGHLIQAPGNLIYAVWWKINKGQPTDWLRMQEPRWFSKKLREKIVEAVGVENPDRDIPIKEWVHYVGMMRVPVTNDEIKYQRAYFFLGNLNMFRGVVASAIVLLIVALIKWLGCGVGLSFRLFDKPFCLGGELIFVVVALLTIVFSISRMHRFGRYYAKEIFVQYLNWKKEKK